MHGYKPEGPIVVRNALTYTLPTECYLWNSVLRTYIKLHMYVQICEMIDL